VGARDYREGRSSDPDGIGVHALDLLTLEVRLVAPVAYFIYLVAQPVTFPLPLKTVAAYGDDWWKPEHIVSNGAFRLVELEETHGTIERNPGYFGDFTGNLERFTFELVDDLPEGLRKYLDGELDYITGLRADEIPPEAQRDQSHQFSPLQTGGFVLVPGRPPFDDVRVRQAIAHALDRERYWQEYWGSGYSNYQGGIVPPGMAGHSPELGLPYDLGRARQLLAEAGYPDPADLPVLKFHYPESAIIRVQEMIKRQLAEDLGIRVEIEAMPANLPWWEVKDSHIQGGGWIADYPDPHNFLRESSFYRVLHARGWRNERLDGLLEEGARTTDRPRRLAMYREADRIMVNEEVVTVPIGYRWFGRFLELKKPWVKGLKYNALGAFSLKDIVIEPH
jgi:oligopeptide transport system substrate-binding protein